MYFEVSKDNVAELKSRKTLLTKIFTNEEINENVYSREVLDAVVKIRDLMS